MPLSLFCGAVGAVGFGKWLCDFLRLFVTPISLWQKQSVLPRAVVLVPGFLVHSFPPRAVVLFGQRLPSCCTCLRVLVCGWAVSCGHVFDAFLECLPRQVQALESRARLGPPVSGLAGPPCPPWSSSGTCVQTVVGNKAEFWPT